MLRIVRLAVQRLNLSAPADLYSAFIAFRLINGVAKISPANEYNNDSGTCN
jgi:hypothetical protein